MSKYAPLVDYLQRSSSSEISLSFSQIESIIGESLPRSAREHRRWWGNSRTADSHVWAHMWLDAGWEQVQLDLAKEFVTFRRVSVVPGR
jgi:putative restriction endonuclease